MSDAFDPDAYIAQPAAPAFDPDAFLKGAPAAPGAAETFVNTAANAVPFGKQATDAITAGLLDLYKQHLQSGGVHLTPQAEAEAKERGIDLPKDELPSFGEEFRNARDTRAERTAEGEREHPIAGKAGTVAGTALSILAPLPGAKVGEGLGGAVASGAINGGAYGALGGLTGSDALAKGDWKGAAEDMAVQGLGGALLGGGLGAAGQQIATRGANALRQFGLKMGRRVLTNGADQLSTRNPLSPEAMEEAMPAVKFLGTTEGTHARLEGMTGEQADSYRKIIDGLKARGVEGSKADDLAYEMLQRADQVRPHTLNPSVPGTYENLALDLSTKAAPGGRLALDQQEALKRSVQGMAKYGRFEETPKNEAMRDAASMLRAATEKRVEEAAGQSADPKVKELAADFVPVKQRLSRLIEATNAAERGVSRGATRGNLGMPEWLMAAGELAAGNPATAVGGPIALKLARNRIPSAVAKTAFSAGNALRGAVPTAGAEQALPLISEQRKGAADLIRGLLSAPEKRRASSAKQEPGQSPLGDLGE
jgi:hypothetical protein